MSTPDDFEEIIRIQFVDIGESYPVGERATPTYAEGSDAPDRIRLSPLGEWQIIECTHEGDGTKLVNMTLGRPVRN